ncbi:MAG: CHASE3 domain-containing protein [Sphingomonas sp.]|nr:CHASE3 domain-containing protein [Sphingomonas sp.]
MRGTNEAIKSQEVGWLWTFGRATPFIVLLFIPLLVFLQARQFDEAGELRAKVNYSYETRQAIEGFLSLHQDIETGQRGYVLSGKDEFLEPYTRARARVGPELKALDARLARKAAFAPYRGALIALTQQKLAFAAETIRLRQNERPGEAALMISKGTGKRIMDRIRAVIATLDAIESSNLKAAIAAADRSRTRLQALSFGLETLFGLLLSGAAWIIARTMFTMRESHRRMQDLSTRQEAIFDAATDGMITHDIRGRIESLNPAATQMYGYEKDELIGQNVRVLFREAPTQEVLESFLAELAQHPPGTSIPVQEIESKGRNGGFCTVAVTISPVPLAEGLRFLAVGRDVTARKQVEQMKTEFVSTVSHELRTPLTSIAASLGLLAGGAAGKLPERARKLIKIAQSNSERLVRLVNEILDIEKIESGKMPFHIRPMTLQPLVKEAVEMNTAFGKIQGVYLSLVADPDGAAVNVDADRLIQVLTNLLSNAVKFSPAGSEVTITILPGERRHRITVRDQGAGIPDVFREHIFSKFAQADSSDGREKGGTGLGLNIVKQIVDRFGGSVSFESELGKGTAFHVDLPAVPPLRPLASPLILICQDDPAAAGEMKRTLRKAGFDSDTASSCDEVRTLAAEKSYSAILIDLEIQGQQTIGLVQHLRSYRLYASVPILVATHDGPGGKISQPLHLVDWLHKPVTVESLLKGVRDTILEGGRRRILHVENDPDSLRVVATAFEGRADLDSALNVKSARQALKNVPYDLVILDLTLPGSSGLELLPEMHREDGTPIPVVIFSAQDDDPELAKRVGAVLTKSRSSLNDLVATVEFLFGKSATLALPKGR